MTTHYHCDLESELRKKYGRQQVYRPENKITLLEDNPIGSLWKQTGKQLQIQPQTVQLLIKPNSAYRVKFTYMHLSPFNHLILRSSRLNRDRGMTVAFSIMCHGHEVQGMQCSNVSIGEIIEFYVDVRLLECRGDSERLTIGALEYENAHVLYIRELCGCECQEIDELQKGLSSRSCNYHGDLDCGQCSCEDGFGGNRCECPLNGASNEYLLDSCRKSPGAEICSANGICECGRCKCQAEHIQGRFCECDSLSCPTVDGKICSGRGQCNCSKCECESGYTGEDCSCSLDKLPCMEGDLECNNHGVCECGMCKCNKGYSGHTCGITNDDDRDQYDETNDEAVETANDQNNGQDDSDDDDDDDVDSVSTNFAQSPTVATESELKQSSSVDDATSVTAAPGTSTNANDETLNTDDSAQHTEEYKASSTTPIEILDHHDIDYTPKPEDTDKRISDDTGDTTNTEQSKDAPDSANYNNFSSVSKLLVFVNSLIVLTYFVKLN
uniref:Tenascin n=1 Tax=Syphacia muris TaxID=451379 RepID=A0A0N5ABW5_9BILA